jgi:polyhydroxyalkanoate synthase
VVNHPSRKKYGFWTNDELPPKAEDWFAGAVEKPGSWWPHWHQWQSKKAGGKVPARKLGNTKYKVKEAAPGSYAKVRA